MNKEDQYVLHEKDAALVFHDDMSFEMVLPKMGDDDMVDANSNTFFVIALALAMRKPEFIEMVDAQREDMRLQMEQGCPSGPEHACGPDGGCGHCGGRPDEEDK